MESLVHIKNSFEQTIITAIAQNPLSAYITAGVILVSGLTLLLLSRRLIIRRLARWIESEGRYGSVDRKLVIASTHAFLLLLTLIPFYWAYGMLHFPKAIDKGLDSFFLLAFTYFFVRFAANAAVFILDTFLRRKENSPEAHRRTRALVPIVRTIIWALGLTFLLDNLGFQVSSIIAGLGIMGVAVGLAGQTILADFFSYLVIVLDQPFAIGDMVTVGTMTGRVMHIGVKTTRIRLASGEIIICPNGELTRSKMGNQEFMQKRPRTFTFGIAYETPLEKLRNVENMIREIASTLPHDIEIYRVTFLNFGDFSLIFEVVFAVPGIENSPLLAAQHDLNLAIMERFAKEGIEFAYPTQVVRVAPNGQPAL